MFRNDRDLAPISMIITNLSAHAYGGEADLGTAFRTSSRGWARSSAASRPRVPNPADPAEDYADKWSRDARLEANFWKWHAAVTADVARLPEMLRGNARGRDVRSIFRVELERERTSPVRTAADSAPAVPRAAPALIIPSAPRPWGKNG